MNTHDDVIITILFLCSTLSANGNIYDSTFCKLHKVNYIVAHPNFSVFYFHLRSNDSSICPGLLYQHISIQYSSMKAERLIPSFITC